MNRIKEIYDYREMIYSLVKRELRGRYQRSVLGILWTMINPLIQIIIYTVIFTFIFPSTIDEYYIYLMTGLIPWTFFNESLNEGASSIVTNGDLIRKIYFPRETLVISKVFAKFVNYMLAMIVVLAVLAFSRRGISFEHLLLLPAVMIIEFLFALGLVLLFSAITVYFRDMEYIVGVILMAWVWATPIMYDANGINPTLKALINLNPMTGIINAYRKILYYHQFPVLNQLAGSIIISLIMIVIGEYAFIRLEQNFAEEL